MNTLKLSLLAAALALFALPAAAQDTAVDNDAEVQASVPAERIANRYADSLFDGDKDLAAKTVESLRSGEDYTVENPDGTTRVDVQLSYNPPGGALGHLVAKLFGSDPKSEMDQDLARLKTLIETGNFPRDAAKPVAAG